MRIDDPRIFGVTILKRQNQDTSPTSELTEDLAELPDLELLDIPDDLIEETDPIDFPELPEFPELNIPLHEVDPNSLNGAGSAQPNNGSALADRPTYAGTFEDQLRDLYDKISNREPFSYDVNADPLYQMYKDQYIQGGKLAMKDTMGQAAALTGGYGSTYGQQVGQQAYDAYLKNLSGVIPELYGMAYDIYRDKGDDLLTRYGLLGDMRDTEYGHYRDDLSDWNYQQELDRQKEETEYNRRKAEEDTAYKHAMDEYNRRKAEEDTAYTRRINEENTEYTRRTKEENDAYNRQQQAFSNLIAIIKASGYNPTDAELAAAGLSREAAEALRGEYYRALEAAELAAAAKSSGSSGGGGGGRSSSGGGSSADNVREIQMQLNAMGANLDVDGIWGPLTQAAYEKYMGEGSGSYNLGELTDATAAGATKQQIETALANRGVNINDPAVQQDIKWALSK